MAARYRKIDPRIWTDGKFRKYIPRHLRIPLNSPLVSMAQVGWMWVRGK